MNLITLSKNGDESAKQMLVNATVKQCKYITGVIIGDDEMANAVCRDAYDRVFNSLERLDDDEDFAVWMKNVAFVAACTACRKEQNDFFAASNTDYEKIPYNPKALFKKGKVKTEIITERVDNCVKNLPPAVRAAAICVFYNGNSAKQLAGIIGADEDFAAKAINAAEEALCDALCSQETELSAKAAAEFMDTVANEDDFEYSVSHTAESHDEPCEATVDEPQKKKGFKKFIFAVIAVFVLAVSAVIAAQYLPPRGDVVYSVPASIKDLATVSSTESAASAASSAVSKAQSTPSNTPAKPAATKTEKAIMPKMPRYIFTLKNESDKNGNLVRADAFAYKGGVPTSAKAKTAVISEQLFYSYSNGGRKCVVKDASGKVCETREYDANGFITKITYPDKKSVKYAMTYTLNDDGTVKTAAYKSTVSGKYAIKYTGGRVAEVAHTVDGKTQTEKREYNDDGAITKRTLVDFAGAKTVYDYSYDTSAMTFSCKVSNGNSIVGNIAEIPQSDNYIYNGIVNFN